MTGILTTNKLGEMERTYKRTDLMRTFLPSDFSF